MVRLYSWNLTAFRSHKRDGYGLKIITANLITVNTAISFGANDIYQITNGVVVSASLGSADTISIGSAATNASLVVDGAVGSPHFAVDADEGAAILIGQTGSVFGPGIEARLNGDDFVSLYNHGKISGGSGLNVNAYALTVSTGTMTGLDGANFSIAQGSGFGIKLASTTKVSDRRIINTGTIAGEQGSIGYASAFNSFGTDDVVVNSGQLIGEASLELGDDTFLNNGSLASDALMGAGNDTFKGRGGFVEGTVFGEAGDDAPFGGDGIDTVVFTGAFKDYTIQVLSNGALRVIDDRPGSPNGTDILTNVEFLNFTDAIVDVAGL